MAKKPFKKSFLYSVLAGALLFVFAVVGAFTLGSTKTTGETFIAPTNQKVVFELTFASKQKTLEAVYVNVGTSFEDPEAVVENEDGETTSLEAKLTLQTSTSRTSTSSSTWKTLGSVDVENFDNAFRWVAVAENAELSSIKRVALTSSCNLEINEIVCIANDGEKITLAVSNNNNTMSTSLKKAAVAGYDAQDSFVSESNAFNTFTEEEGIYLSAIRTVLEGNSIVEGNHYVLPGNFNAFAILLMIPSVLIFGESVFALRLTSLIATTLTLLGVFLLTSLLFKKTKYGFISAFVLAFSGILTTVGRLGAPYALVACALVYSVYFAYRFFANGISSYYVIRGALNPLFAGLFAAVAIAMETLAVIPALVVIVIFCLGMRRQKLAYAVTKEKLEEAEKEEKLAKAKADYIRKNRAAVGFCSIGLFVGLLAFLLTGAVGAYYAYAKVYGESVTIFTILWKGISESCKTATMTTLGGANAVLPLGWFLPMKASTLLGSVTDGAYAVWSALANPALTVFALSAFAFATVETALIFTKKKTDKKSLRISRIYLVLLGGTLTAMLAPMIKVCWTNQASLLFYAFYLSFIPLALYILNETEDVELSSEGEEVTKSSFACVVTVVVMAVAVIFFALATPALYGFAVSESLANGLFGWMSILSNGIFR